MASVSTVLGGGAALGSRRRSVPGCSGGVCRPAAGLARESKLARHARVTTAASSAKSASTLACPSAGAPVAVLAAHQAGDRLRSTLGRVAGVVCLPGRGRPGGRELAELSAPRTVRMGSSAAPAMVVSGAVARERLPSRREAVVGVAEPHDRQAGAARIVRRGPGLRRRRTGGPAPAVAVGAPSMASCLRLIPQRWAAPSAGGERENCTGAGRG